MPPKSKEIPTKKPLPQILRPSISGASLNYVPDNALDGYQERIETGIPWTLTEEAARHHKHECFKKYIPKLQLTQALQNKINNSIMCGFFDEKSKFSLKDQWDILLPMTLWDNEKFSNEEKKIWFQSCNSLTNDMIQLIKRAVQHDDRNVLKNDFKMVNVLRVTDCKMTEMDNGLKDFLNLTVLNLCGNYIADVNSSVLPQGLQMLELQANRITSVGTFAEHLPNLIYLGLARNLLSNDSLDGLARLPRQLTVLDLSDNDICDLEPVLTALSAHPNLVALQLTGNPCSLCAAYARTIFMRLPRLQWLDTREILPTDRPVEPFDPHPDDLRSAYFNFTVFRIMSIPPPPKPDKGAITAFHVEFELPLLDSTRRNFLMFRNNESLIEMLPPSEDEESSDKLNPTIVKSKITIDAATSSHEFDIYNQLRTKNSREICHLKIFESNRVQWNKIMNFQEPTIKIFCPNLTALRDTFRTVVTVRIIYTVTTIGKQSKSDKKSAQYLKQPGEQRVTLATINCALKQPDWSQQSQHFHWDDSLGTNDAIHWGDGDLSVLQYTLAAVKTPKGKPDSDPSSTKQFPPENLTCHFGFGIDTLRV
ncbi:unnamed protein product, partial [Brenthis ino]